MQPCFWPCLLDGLWPCGAALSSAWSLALSAFAPGGIPRKDPGPGPSIACLCLLMDPITSSWLCLLSSAHVGLGPVGEVTAPGVTSFPALSALEEQLCSSWCIHLKLHLPGRVRALVKSDEYFYCWAQASTGFMWRFKHRAFTEHHVALQIKR